MTSRRLVVLAFIASALTHLVLLALTWDFSLLNPGKAAEASADEAVELVLVPDDEEAATSLQEEAATPPARDPDRPTAYTEIPERLASETPPDRADFLALYNAQAADRQPGGEKDGKPAADEQAEFPQVAIAPEDLDAAPGMKVEDVPPQQQQQRRQQQLQQQQQQQQAQRQQPQQSAASPPGRDGRSAPEQRTATTPGQGDWPLPPPVDRQQAAPDQAHRTTPAGGVDWLRNEDAPSLLAPGEGGEPGDRGFAFDQRAQGDLTAGTTIEGDFSLNTYEWNYAPWMHRFVQDLYRNWMAPPAYALGVIYGYTRIRLVVEKDGRPSAMEIVETEGHESLHRASTAALQAFAPYAPLPGNFPEEHLVILLSLHYPQWKK